MSKPAINFCYSSASPRSVNSCPLRSHKFRRVLSRSTICLILCKIHNMRQSSWPAVRARTTSISIGTIKSISKMNKQASSMQLINKRKNRLKLHQTHPMPSLTRKKLSPKRQNLSTSDSNNLRLSSRILAIPTTLNSTIPTTRTNSQP